MEAHAEHPAPDRETRAGEARRLVHQASRDHPDRRRDHARVYADKQWKFLGNTLDNGKGFISTRDKPPSDSFYASSGVSYDRKESSESKAEHRNDSEQEAGMEEDVPLVHPQPVHQPVHQPMHQPVHQPVQQPGAEYGYLVEPRTPGSIQDRLIRNQFGGDEQAYRRWKKQNGF